MKKLIILTFLCLLSIIGYGQEQIAVKNDIFEVVYSEFLEQPISLKYRSTNRPKNVSRTGLDFYIEPNIKTSDSKDYVKNIYDKGHLAPAASFSDNMTNLKQTFTYLNCVLQHEKLNRGEWAKLEDQERKWDDNENLTVIVIVKFDEIPQRVPTNAAIPTHFEKHIFFEEKNSWKCFVFPNESPKFAWKEYQINCTH
jgi:DNA/RNA endonuclease G (NUC1)